MEAAKYTPGPWRLNDPYAGRAHVLSDDYHSIDAGHGFLGDPPQREPGFGIMGFMSLADARLISAAPELLEALQAVARITRTKGMTDAERKAAMRDIGETARAAISKALGGEQQ